MIGFNETQSKTVVNNVIDELKLNPITDTVPKHVTPTIQPVFEVKKKTANIVRSNTITNATSVTIFTTPTDRDFYLTGYCLSHSQGSLSANTGASITCVIEGTARKVAVIKTLSATDNQGAQVVSGIVIPIKCDRNSVIAVLNDVASTTSFSEACIIGYTEEAGNNLTI